MKFLERINERFSQLQLEQVPAPSKADGALPSPPDSNTSEQPPTPEVADEVDSIGDAANEQIQENIKLCADVIHALSVWVTGKFNEIAPAVDRNLGTALQDSIKQLQDLERAAVVTSPANCTPELLGRLANLVKNLPNNAAVQAELQ